MVTALQVLIGACIGVAGFYYQGRINAAFRRGETEVIGWPLLAACVCIVLGPLYAVLALIGIV